MDSKGGTFLLTAAGGKSLSYRSAAGLLARRQKPKWVEITVLGSPTRDGEHLVLRATVTGEPFRLADDTKAETGKNPTPYEKLQQPLADGSKVVSVVGKVTLRKTSEDKKKLATTLIVTGFEIGK